MMQARPPLAAVPPPRRRRKRKQGQLRGQLRKSHTLCKDWGTAMDYPATSKTKPAMVYVLDDGVRCYTGRTTLLADGAILRAHFAGKRKSTKGFDYSMAHVAFAVRGFPNTTAASRFESLVKKEGAKAGVPPKLKAAIAAVNAALPRRELSIVSNYYSVT
ncbi:hypothetical protein M885DRAFT_517931 [Pelagophyceae sp. CCMP2097]|nr:hypothetical protein M885DRAFT_517931 [Pelagophyceae sp. CCMP2097]